MDLFCAGAKALYAGLSTTGHTMQRLTISIDDELDHAFDDLMADKGYQSKSEAIRDLVREAVEARRMENAQHGDCVASLSYVYDHHIRDLAQRIVEMQHDHHDIVVSTMHVHLDHHTCLENTILRGPVAAVRRLADRIQAERGVRFSRINLIGAEPPHSHGPGADHSH